MISLLDVPRETQCEKGPWPSTIEVLFREARRRARRRRIRRSVAAVASLAIVGAAMVVGVSSAGSSSTKPSGTPSVLAGASAKVLTCSGASVVRPRSLIVTCADANTSLQATKWSTWGAAGATGTTTFALNLCTPYCAASPVSYFPRSSVSLSAPIATRHGNYFSRLVVHYLQGSTPKVFTFSWSPGASR